MKICKISTKDVLNLKFGGSLPEISGNYQLLCDELFDIGIAYIKEKKIIKDVYIPLELLNHNFKNVYSFFDVIKKNDTFLVRVKSNHKIFGGYFDEIEHFITQHKNHYNTFCVELDTLNYPFHLSGIKNFSLTYYLKELAKGPSNIGKIAIVADPGSNLQFSYEEGVDLYNYLHELDLNLDISLITYPLSNHDFDDIISCSSIVHFCGHIEKKGLYLGNSYYNPRGTLTDVAPLLFLNGCQLSDDILIDFINRSPKNIIYRIQDIKDHKLENNWVKQFYLGLILGYRIGDIARKTINYKDTRVFGWLTNRFIL